MVQTCSYFLTLFTFLIAIIFYLIASTGRIKQTSQRDDQRKELNMSSETQKDGELK